MRTANLAIVFTDIAGFTERTARQSHADNERLLRAHARLLEPVFRAFEGRIVKRIGDAYLVVFRSPTKAVLCGAAIEDRIWEYNRRASEEQRLQIRVAVNSGEVRLEKGDVFGAPVNLASRVESVAIPGEVLFTESVWLAMDRAEVPSQPRGVHALRGVPEPVRLFSLPRAIEAQRPPYGRIGLARAGRLPDVDPRLAGQPRALAWRALAGLGAAALTSIVLWGGSLRARQPAPPLPPAIPAPSTPAPESPGSQKARLVPQQGAPAGTATNSSRSSKAAKARPSQARALAKGAARAHTAVPRAMRQLLGQLHSRDCDVRARAAEELGKLGDRRAAGPLKSLAAADQLAGEGQGRSIFDCSSRGAARLALERLR